MGSRFFRAIAQTTNIISKSSYINNLQSNIMKRTAVNLKTAIYIALVTWNINSFAQVETIMYVMKNGAVVFQSPVSRIDNVTFDKASSDSILILQKSDGSPNDKIFLNDIQQLSFSDETLSVETSTGSETVAFDDIGKLLFGNINTTEIKNPPAKSDFNVLANLTPTGDVEVKSSVAIQSLKLYSIDGKMIFKRNYNSIATQCIVPLQNSVAGVYLLRVETEQGAVVKKIVKPLNK